MITPAHNTLNEEIYRLTGTLPADRIEDLLDKVEIIDRLEGMQAHVDEAKSAMPDEDCLEDILKLLRNLHGNLRKSDTKEAIGYILEQAEDLQLSLGRQSEYGRDELQKIADILGDI